MKKKVITLLSFEVTLIGKAGLRGLQKIIGSVKHSIYPL